MSEDTQLNMEGGIHAGAQKVSSKKDTLLYGRITKIRPPEPEAKQPQKVFNTEYNYNASFRSAFQYSGIGMAMMSAQGRILDANNSLCNFLGYTKQELTGVNFLDLAHPDDNDGDHMLLNRMLTNLINYYSLEKRYISRHKKVLWGMHTVSKVYNNDGTLEMYALQIVDLTRRRELNDELSRKNSELEAIRSGLINKITQLEDLNHIIAHNLRGPTNNIRLLVEMLKDKQENKESDGLRLDLGEIVSYLDEGSTSLLTSLNALMDVVQISMNKDIPFDDCDVHAIINELLDQLNSIIYEKGAFVQLDMGVPFIRYPRVFLESIIYNLLSNSLKYTHEDRMPEILIRTYMAGDRIMLSVKDNGLGIDLVKYGNKIFKLNQIFHQGKDSKGVGLYITKAQIESFGGSITVKSRENEGSEFIVTL